MGHFKVWFWKSTFGSHFGRPLWGVHSGRGPQKRSIEEVHGRGPWMRSMDEVHGRGPRKRFMEEVYGRGPFLKSTLGDDFGEPLWGSILEVHIGGPHYSLHISVING